LLPHALADCDGAHDLGHLLRVWKNAAAIQAEEGGDPVILAASVLLHDCVRVDKDSPLRASASRLAADKAAGVLAGLGWVDADIAAVAHAIAAHSFSAGVAPQTLEAKILQDADRLDAIGAVGVARSFYVAGRQGRALYDPHDPQASRRPQDDARYALDHFHAKLLKLASQFNTNTGRRLAHDRQQRLERFLDDFMGEI
jgi:uncharacterized protein